MPGADRSHTPTTTGHPSPAVVGCGAWEQRDGVGESGGLPGRFMERAKSGAPAQLEKENDFFFYFLAPKFTKQSQIQNSN
jgi:hypothetical protein